MGLLWLVTMLYCCSCRSLIVCCCLYIVFWVWLLVDALVCCCLCGGYGFGIVCGYFVYCLIVVLPLG